MTPFLLFKRASHIPKFLHYLNSKHSSIKFTCDVETYSKLNFLDILIHNGLHKFETSVYRKLTFTGLGMKLNSFIPYYFKNNLISCLINRAFKICSNEKIFKAEVKFLTTYLTQNGFPCNFVQKMFRRALNSIYNPEPIKCTVPKKPLFISVPYLGKDSFLLKRKLTSLIGRFYPQFKIICCFKSSFTIGSMFKFKDRLPHLLMSSVIYQYSCRQCSSSYVGQTVKQFKVRISQPQGRSLTENYLTCPKNSKILEHSHNSGHPVVENDLKFLDCCGNFDIRILESLYIHKLKPSFNDQHNTTDLFIVH